MNIADIRAQYPQYSDMSDADLVKGLHDKYYADMPFDQFASKVGFAPAANKQVAVNRAALNPEAMTPFGTVSAEADSGFNPAAALIGAGRTYDRINAGMRAVRLTAGNYLYRSLGLDKAAQENQDQLDQMDAQQNDATRQYKALQDVHPGSTQLGAVGALLPVPPAALPVVAAAEYGSPVERATGATAALLGNKLMQLGGQAISRAVTSNTAKGMANVESDMLAKGAQDVGYTLPPSQVNPTVTNRALEGFSGKIATQQAASAKNQPVTDALIKEDLGLARDVKVNPIVLESVRTKAYNAGYVPIKNETGLKADQQYASDVQNLGGSDYASMASEVPEMANPNIAALKGALDKPEFSGATAINLVRKLRKDANANFKNAQDPVALESAHAQIDAADALEGLIERNLAARNMPDALKNFQEARTLIAKTITAERALSPRGTFNAADLGRDLDKGRPLSGNQKLVAEVAQNFPKATQELTSSMPGISPLDYAAYGGVAAALHNPMVLGGLVGRPLVRSTLLSPMYQKAMVRPGQYNPGLLGDFMPTLLDSPMARASGGLLALSAITN